MKSRLSDHHINAALSGILLNGMSRGRKHKRGERNGENRSALN